MTLFFSEPKTASEAPSTAYQSHSASAHQVSTLTPKPGHATAVQITADMLMGQLLNAITPPSEL